MISIKPLCNKYKNVCGREKGEDTLRSCLVG